MDDFFSTLLNETHELRRKLLEANIDPSELRPFAITRDEATALKQAPFLTYDHYESIENGYFEMNGFRYAVTDHDGPDTDA